MCLYSWNNAIINIKHKQDEDEIDIKQKQT